MKPRFFAKPADFRKWLSRNHRSSSELLVGFFKVGSGKPSMTWPESVDEALCFGWIDGVRKRIDEESYSIRFTPRKRSSIWSAVNIKKAEELKANGSMGPAGIAAYENRTEKRSRVYAYENEAVLFSTEFEKKFKSNKDAWNFFALQPPSYRKTVVHWIMRAKREETRVARLEKTIEASENHKRLDQFLPSK